MGNAPSSTPQSGDGSSCPIPESQRSKVYNVYNQVIQPNESVDTKGEDLLDPRNNMPLEANQKPCPGQKELLSTQRIQSNIPKGGTNSTWIYPSPQMFYNGACLDVQFATMLNATSHTMWRTID
jgi:cytochrome c heme-lyase